jgi:FtsP/CotA-like multicopper oxidase with cupredoxin domain
VDPTLQWANPNNIDAATAQAQVSQGLAPPYPPGYNGSQQVLPNGTTLNPNGWNAQSPIPIVTHLHGGETPSSSDGNPDAWFTPNGNHGPAYNSIVPTDPNAAVYEYPNSQQATTLWYHDHAMGITRLNVLSGLAGFYLIRDPTDAVASTLPKGKYEMPLAIQDRTFLTDSSIYYPNTGSYPETNPYWQNTFLGNTIMVNGKVWPNMNVDQAQYRLRVLDGSNSAFYNLTFSNGMTFTQIGTDGGYIKTPTQLTSLLIGPAERADIIVDFSNMAPGEKIILQNGNIPSLSPTQRLNISEIMQFTVAPNKGPAPFNLSSIPSPFNPTLSGNTFPTLPNATNQRILTLFESMGNNGAILALLDGQTYNSHYSENPQVGTIEDWVIVNPTMDAHPIHTHLVQFQLVQRQTIDANGYSNDWIAINGIPPLNHTTRNLPSLAPYLIGSPTSPQASEQGWKDTIIAYPGEVMTIRIRFTQQDGSTFPFDPTAGPGYVWHCHILEHEDNQMMRPLILTKANIQPSKPFPLEIAISVAVILVIAAVAITLLLKRLSHARKQKIVSKVT